MAPRCPLGLRIPAAHGNPPNPPAKATAGAGSRTRTDRHPRSRRWGFLREGAGAGVPGSEPRRGARPAGLPRTEREDRAWCLVLGRGPAMAGYRESAGRGAGAGRGPGVPGGVGSRGRREGAGRGPAAGQSRCPRPGSFGRSQWGAEAGRRAALIGWRWLLRRARPPLHVCAGVGSWRQGGRRMPRGRSRAGPRPRRALPPAAPTP